MDLKKNDIVKLNIDSVDLGGNGVGRIDGRVVFVPRTAAGDEIYARILKVKPNLAYAKTERIITPSPDRVEPVCPVYGKCGGCVFDHISYEAELKIKENHVLQCFKRISGLAPEAEAIKGSDSLYHYRNKAQFPVSMQNGELKTGFYANHSHRVVHCPDCNLQPEEFAGILSAAEKYILKYKIEIYDEEKRSGILRHIYLRKAFTTGEIMVCAVINSDNLPFEKEFIESVTASCGNVKSVIININKKDTNVVLGDVFRTVFGSDYITDSLAGVTFRLSPRSFYQINHDQAEFIYAKASEYAAPCKDDTVIDLYCGTGTIGLSMADKAGRIIGVEIVKQAVEDAVINAQNNGIKNAEFICADAFEAARELKVKGVKPDIVIIDPPRKGCDRELVKTICEMSPSRVVYVSCDPATLARDCGAFDTLGYKTVKICPADMFPRTGNVETVALLIRK